MKPLRVPRSGGMIVGMFIALLGTSLLPVVFMAALVHSSEPTPRPLRNTVGDLVRPLRQTVARLLSDLF
jgi:hypothetical protein